MIDLCKIETASGAPLSSTGKSTMDSEINNLKSLVLEMNQFFLKIELILNKNQSAPLDKIQKKTVKNALLQYMDTLVSVHNKIMKMLEIDDDLKETMCRISIKVFFLTKVVVDLKKNLDKDAILANSKLIEKFSELNGIVLQMITSDIK